MKRRQNALALAIFATTFAAPLGAEAADKRCPLTMSEQVAAVSVAPNGSFVVADGRRVRFAAVLLSAAPSPRDLLSELVLNKTVDLAFDRRSVDRNGDVVAHVFVGTEGSWVQARLVTDGMARVRTHADIRACAPALLALEDQARRLKKGLWSSAVARVRQPNELLADIGTFQIVEGVPLKVVARRDRTYLNFGPNYRTDFTATIARRDLKLFPAVDPSTWTGRRVRIRGWLSLLNGPEIEITHPEQIEILGKP